MIDLARCPPDWPRSITLPSVLGSHGTRLRVLVLEHKHKEFCWLSLTGVCRYGMNIVGTFIKRLSGTEFHLRSPLDLHDHVTFEHVNKDLRVMPVRRRAGTRRIFHSGHGDLHPRHADHVAL